MVTYMSISTFLFKLNLFFFFFSSRRRHTRFDCDWSSDVCSSDLALRRGDRRLQFLLRGDAHGLRTDDLVRADLRRCGAVRQAGRHRRLDGVLDQQPTTGHSRDQKAHDEEGHPRLASARRRRLELVLLNRCGASRRPLFAHFRAVASAIAWTNPCVVYSRATIDTSSPSLRAVSAVTGPMHAISASPRMAGSRSSGNARTKLTTVDELVKVITSTPSPSKSRSSAGPASVGQTAR